MRDLYTIMLLDGKTMQIEALRFEYFQECRMLKFITKDAPIRGQDFIIFVTANILGFRKGS